MSEKTEATWEEMLPKLVLIALGYDQEEGARARSELLRMARAADCYLAEQKAKKLCGELQSSSP